MTKPKWQRVGECLYRRREGCIIHIRVNGRKADGTPTKVMRSTETDNVVKAKEWLQRWRDEERVSKYGGTLPGAQLHDKMVTVGDLIDDYVSAGHPSKKMKTKPAETIARELRFLNPIRQWWAKRNPNNILLGDCDAYRDWRLAGGFVSTFSIRGHQHSRPTKGGNTAVDMELSILSNVLHLARRRGKLRHHPLLGRGKYVSAADVRHCREVAPTPEELHRLAEWLRGQGRDDVAELVLVLAWTGLRIGEGQRLAWSMMDWDDEIINVKRSKRGILPWIPMTPELKELLLSMRQRAEANEVGSDLLFPPLTQGRSPATAHHDFRRDASAIRKWIKQACTALGIRHVAPHGLRSYFVTSRRESGLMDAEIAMLIGDKSGPALIASTYGDVRPVHLMQQARHIKLKWRGNAAAAS
jgi:integrase